MHVRNFRGRALACPGIFASLVALSARADAQTLTTFTHHVLGARVRAAPEELFVPKGIPGSLIVGFLQADGTPHPEAARLGRGLYVEGVLRGPAFPAYRLLGLPGEPLMLPPIALEGEYQIDDLRVVDIETGEARALATPSRVAVHVFGDVLVTQVTSRPLGIDEIRARGISIDETNFTALEFAAVFTLAGRPFTVTLPVVTPRFTRANELIGQLEREALLVQARRVNELLAERLALPPELQLPGLDLEIRGLNFEEVAGDDGESTTAGRPAGVIPALLVIPGSVGFLDQFFSVQVYTANAAPLRSGISVHSLEAELVLPPGLDRVVGTDDDPLRLARIDGVEHPIVPVRGPGADGRLGTADDLARLQPGQTGLGELLVEGRREGLHSFDLRLRGVLDGFAGREVHVEGVAAGSVLVRNPKFSIALSHPRAVRAGEPYTVAITVLNTSEQPANLVTAGLRRASLAGAELAPGQSESIALGDIGPGQSARAEIRLVARSTGEVRMTQLQTADGLSGRIDLSLAVDERGVELAPYVIGYPKWVALLDATVRSAADRVLGQALSAATAATLPPGVRKVELETVRARIIELAEAGQRIGHGDAASRVYLDLLLDWHGGRTRSLAFDQILRETSAGAELKDALMGALAASSDEARLAWIRARAADVAGRGEPWGFLASDAPGIELSAKTSAGEMSSAAVDLTESGVYRGTGGATLLVRDPGARAELELVLRVPAGHASEDVAWISVDGEGSGGRVEWLATGSPTQDVCYRYLPNEDANHVTIDLGCTRAATGQLAVTRAGFQELAPELLAVDQELGTLIERANGFCFGPNFVELGQDVAYQNFGSLALLLFSKPMSAESLARLGAITLDDGTMTTGVSVQPGGRVVLANFRKAFGTLRPRSAVLAADVTDLRGHALGARTLPVQAIASEGAAIVGRVFGVEGDPVPGIPVTLTMHDTIGSPCLPNNVRASQVLTDAEGRFSFDFVMAGVPYSVSATDIRGLSPAAAALLREAAPTGEIDPEEIERLATDVGTRELWAAAWTFADGAGSVLLAQSVDRAVLRDQIALDGPRVGSEVPVALRFRGRAIVAGTVLASDGVTPVEGVAVNLFPDTESRELGRGTLSGEDGRYLFAGVPLGSVGLQADAPDGRSRALSARLSQPGERRELPIVLSRPIEPRASLEGTVYDSDGQTPHPRAELYVLDDQQYVLARTTADAFGAFVLEDLPASSAGLVAFSSDGQRAATRSLSLAPNVRGVARVVLPGTGLVSGRVERANGDPVPGALVAGGEAIVTTDALGRFTLTGVPSGVDRTLMAGLPAGPGNPFVRQGSASVDVLPGLTSYAIIRLEAAGRITGIVRDAASQPVPFVRVALPRPPWGFFWTNADADARYELAPVALAEHTVSAPAPPLRTPNIDALVNLAQEAIATRSQAQLEGAMGQLLPRLSTVRPEDPATPSPGAFGSTRARVEADGQSVTADLTYLRQGAIAGRVLNHLGAPISAQITLSALALDPFGLPRVQPVSGAASDPATGAFRIEGVSVGPFRLVARSSFYPQSAFASGITTQASPNAEGLTLSFSAAAPQAAPLTGLVLRDGRAAGADIRVQIDGAGYEILTTEDGTFDTQLALAAGYHSLVAIDPASGRRGAAGAQIADGRPGYAEITLLSNAGALDLTVLDAAGAPAAGASVKLARMTDLSPPAIYTSGVDGLVHVTALTQGTYAATACKSVGQTRLCASGTVRVPGVGTARLTLRLQPTASIVGLYVEADGVTPVTSAQVLITHATLGDVAMAVTDGAGRFDAEGLPLGSITIVARNAVTGRAAIAGVALVAPDQRLSVTLREEALGEVIGGVIASSGSGLVPGARVVLTHSSSLFPSVTVTTDPAGEFSIPGVPPGAFTLLASAGSAGGTFGTAGATMPSPSMELRVDVALERRGSLYVYVRDPNGAPTPARISTFGRETDSNAAGRAELGDLPMSSFVIDARSLAPGHSRSAGSASATLDLASPTATVTVTLSGVGTVSGEVHTALGAPASGANVTLEHSDHSTESSLTAADGRFAFDDVAPGEARLRAERGALAARATVTVSQGQDASATLTLGPSGAITARLVRADGVTPVAGADVVLSYTAASSALGSALVTTSSAGELRFEAVPHGPFVLRARVPSADGVLAHRGDLDTALLDLGDLRLDELAPIVTATFPPDGARDVPLDATIELTFSEEMDASFADERAAYLADALGAVIPADLEWRFFAGELRTLALLPRAPLASEATYSVVVLGPAQPTLSGFAGPGPVDLAERPLEAPFVLRFTTVDGRPPELLSFAPEHLAENVDPSAVLRLTFDEAIDRASAAVELADLTTSAIVPTTLAFALGDTLLVATPATFLTPNHAYEARLVMARDRAQNAVVGLPIVHRFDSLDTLGPIVSDLSAPFAVVGGAAIPFHATLSPPEGGVQIQATQDLRDFVLSAPGSGDFTLTVASSGTATVRARGIDRLGNYGPWYEESFSITPNAPPVVTLTQISGPLLTGQPYVLRVSATDDSRVVRTLGRLEGSLSDERELAAATVQLTGTVPAQLGPSSTATFFGLAEDNSGLVASAAPLTLPIGDGVAPTVSILAPDRELVPGETIEVHVVTDDAFGVTHVTLETFGAASFTGGGAVAGAPTHGDLSFSVPIPSDAPSHATLSLLATARDAAANTRELSITRSIADVVPPAVVSVSPAHQATSVSLTASVLVTFSEPVVGVGSASFRLLDGPAAIPATVTLATDRSSATLTPDAPLSPLASYDVSLVGITDDAGLALPSFSSSFTTESRDLSGPRLLSLRPVDTSTGVLLPLAVEARFDEPILLASVTGFALDPPLPVTIELADEGRTVRFLAGAELGTAYVATWTTAPSDALGNPARTAAGQAWTPAITHFTTARVSYEITVGGYPSAGRAIEGRAAQARLVADEGLTIDVASFTQDGQPIGSSFGPSPTVAFAPPLGAPLTVTLGADVIVAGDGLHTLAPELVAVLPASGDADADGLTNGDEAAAGTNAFADDAALDPDLDGLSNAQEIPLGTDPFDADSDDDGILDGADLDPLSGNRAPGLGLGDPAQTASVLALHGGSDGLELPQATALDPISIEAWIYATQASPTGAILDASGGAPALGLGVDPTGHYTLAVRVVGQAPVVHTAPSALGFAEWHHLAATYDGHRARLFVDGRREIDVALSGALDHVAGPPRLAPAFDAWVDELRVWSYARTAAEIQATLHQILRGERAGLVAAYGFDDPAIGADATGHGHDAAAIGAPFTEVWGAPVYSASRRVALSGAAITLGPATVDLDNDTLELRATRLPSHGRLLAQGVELTAPGPFFGSLRYVSEPGYLGLDTVEIVASDARATSPTLVIELETPPAKTWVGGDPSGPEDWTVAANWSPAGVPTAGDVVSIPVGAPPAALSEDASIGGLYLGAGTTLTLGATLQVGGHLLAEGEITGAGTVAIWGSDAVVRGRLPSLRIEARTSLVGETRVRGDLALVNGNHLGLDGHALLVSGDASVVGALEMTEPSDLLEVEGELVWRGPGELRAGLLRAHGRVVITSGFVPDDQGSHTVELVGAGATVRMDLAGAAQNHFRNLDVWAASLTIEPPLYVSAPPLSLYVSGRLRLGDVARPCALASPAESIGVGGDALVGAGSTVTVGALSVGGALSVEALGSVVATSLAAGELASVLGSVSATHLTLEGGPAGALDFASSPSIAFVDLIVRRPVALTGATYVAGDLRVEGGALSVGSATVSVAGGLFVGAGAVDMSSPSGVLAVAGDVDWGGYVPSTLSAGTLRVGGRFDVEQSFVASDEHRVELVGAAAFVRMSFAPFNHFGALVVRAPTLTLEAPLFGGPRLGVSGSFTLGTAGHPSVLDSSGEPLQIDAPTTIGPGSRWTSDADLTVAAPLVVDGEVGAPLGALRVHELFVRASGSVVADTLVFFAAAATLARFTPDAARISFADLRIERPLTIDAPLAVPGALIVRTTFPVYATFDLGAETVTAGSLALEPFAALLMHDDLAVLEVLGDVAWTGGSDLALTAGRLRAHGRLAIEGASAVFRAQGTHTLELAGSGASIRMDRAQSSNHLHDLEITGSGVFIEPPLDAGPVALYATGDVRVGALAAPAAFDAAAQDLTLEGDLHVAMGSTLLSDATVVVGGALDVGSGGLLSASTLALQASAYAPTELDLDLDPSRFTIDTLRIARPARLTAPLSLPGSLHLTWTSPNQGALDLDGFALDTGGDVTVESASLRFAGATIDVGGSLTSSGRLEMDDPADLALVGGDFTALGGFSSFTAGRISVGGDFAASAAAFVASGGHTVELRGPSSTLRVEAAFNEIRHLSIASPDARIDASTPDVHLTGTLTLRGASASERARLTIGLGQSMAVDGAIFLDEHSDLVVFGDLTGASCLRDPTATSTGFSCP